MNAVPTVTGFVSDGELIGHYEKHKLEFPDCKNQYEYLQRARTFLEADLSTIGAEECKNADGNTVRYCQATNEYAIIQPTRGIIVTYFNSSFR